MPLHRLVTPTYPGGLPGTHDLINDGTPSDAPADGAKSGGPNSGTYFVAFGEDAISFHANRPHQALSENTDFLDDVVSGALPVPADTTVAPGGVVTSVQLVGSIFVGRSGEYTDTQQWRDKLVKVVDPNTNIGLLDSNNAPIVVTDINDSGDAANVIGTEATGFYTNPWIHFSGTGVPTGVGYKLLYAKRGSLVSAIQTKTWLDMLTRFGIDGAPKVDGEVECFMHEASRRASAQIQALAASTVETPGAGDNILPKAVSMTLDLDPTDDAAAAARYLRLRAGRAGVPRQLLDIGETSKGSDEILLHTDRDDLKLEDARMLSNNGPLALSDATHQFYRTMEVDEGTQPSVLEMVNRRWTATVGDGVNSFGDFNGATALSDALAHAVAYGVTDVCLLLKKGTYDVNQLSISASFYSVSIRGLSRSGCLLRNMATVGNAGIVLAQNVLVHLQSVDITDGGAGSIVDIRCNDAVLRMEDCALSSSLEFSTQAGVYTNRFGNMYVSRCVLSTTVVGVPPILFTANDFNFNHHGFVFEDCLIKPNATHTPAVRLKTHVSLATSVLSGIMFNRCRIYLGNTSDAGGGVMTGNSGAFEVAFEAGTIVGPQVKDIEWKDCLVSTSGALGVKCLLVLSTVGATGSIDLHKVSINGGRWVLDANTALAPFFIGPASDAYLSTAPREVVIKDVSWGFESGPKSYGAAHALYNTALAGESGGFVIVADAVRMHRVKWLSLTAQSTNGDLFVVGPTLDIDTLDFSGYAVAGGVGTVPEYRIRLSSEGAGSQGSRVANVQIVAGIAGVANAVTSAVWRIGGNSTSALLLEKCTSSNFIGGAAAGFYLPAVTGQTRRIRLVLCASYGNSGPGFFYSHDGVQVDGLEDIVFDRCDFSGNGLQGIYITGLTLPTPVAPGITHIVNCRFYANGSYGLAYAPGTFDGDDRLIMTGNSFEDNNSSGDQVMIGSAGTFNGDMYSGVMVGNDASGDGFRFYGAGTIGALMFMQGIETTYTGFVPGGPITITHRQAVSGQGMFQNNANYVGT